MQIHVGINLLAQHCSFGISDLDVHEQPAHEEAEGATTIVDAILYLVGGMEGDNIGVVIQEDTPARTRSCGYRCCHTVSTSVTAVTCLGIHTGSHVLAV